MHKTRSAFDALSRRHKAFVKAYLTGPYRFNAAKSYLHAGAPAPALDETAQVPRTLALRSGAPAHLGKRRLQALRSTRRRAGFHTDERGR